MSKQWQSRQQFGSRLGLERIERLCEYLGHPEAEVPVIHVAGTNGKGSTAAFLASILVQSGYKVGLFTSPHLVHYKERFQINGSCAADTVLQDLLGHVEAVAEKIETDYPDLGPITEFEVATAVGFLLFSQNQVNAAVIETGLGGRFDATNVVDPVLSVITPIAYDHMEWLGTTVAKIAGEKAGIIKQCRPTAIGLQAEEAMVVLENTAAERQSATRTLATSGWLPGSWDRTGGKIYYPYWSGTALPVPLLGKHQLENAGLALLAAEMLHGQGWGISAVAVQQGLAKTIWPGRLEPIATSRAPLLLDGAHNAQGLQVLADNLGQFAGSKARYTFVFAMLSNKSVDLLDPLLPIADSFVITQPRSSRIPAYDPERLAGELRERGMSAVSCPNARSALQLAVGRRANDLPLVVCGSLYLLGEIKELLEEGILGKTAPGFGGINSLES